VEQRSCRRSGFPTCLTGATISTRPQHGAVAATAHLDEGITVDRLFLFAQQDSSASGTATFILFIALMGGVFYFFIIRPQRTRVRKQRQLVTSLELGDRVRTVGGIMGTITRMDGDEVTIDVESGTLRMVKWAIAGKIEELDGT